MKALTERPYTARRLYLDYLVWLRQGDQAAVQTGMSGNTEFSNAGELQRTHETIWREMNEAG